MNGGNFNIDKNGDIIIDSVKNVLNTIWNAAQFFITYAEIDNVKIEKNYELSKNKMDEYILTKFSHFIKNYDANMENYKIADACTNVERFVDDLNNWYIRRNKDRFWKSESDIDKKNAYQTLFYVLKNFAIAISPLLPFLTEKIYEKLQKFES